MINCPIVIVGNLYRDEILTRNSGKVSGPWDEQAWNTHHAQDITAYTALAREDQGDRISEMRKEVCAFPNPCPPSVRS